MYTCFITHVHISTDNVDGVKAGDIVQMKGPWTKKKYTANMKKELGMIAGGTGITPMLQVCKRILENPEDKTQVTLLYANVTEKDILLREELDAMAAQHENFTVKYVLEKPQASWRGLSGYINQTVLANHMPAPSADNMVFVCGPPGFMKAISGNKTPKKKQGELSGALKGLGFDETMVFKF